MSPHSSSDVLEIQPGGPVQGRVRPPGSKSLTNRALITAALADGDSILTGVLQSDDTRVMIDGLGKLGIDIRHESPDVVHVTGCAGRIPADQADLSLGNSGTSMRFLTAVAALGNGTYRLDGVERMRERPIADLLVALGTLGGAALSEHGNGCPPVVVHGRGLQGGAVRMKGDTSSQFLSGLLMAVPYARQRVVIEIEGALVSEPYVAMTLAVMSTFGVEVATKHFERFSVSAPACYHACRYKIEPDASAASYFFAAAAITGGAVTVEGLSRGSLQGDVAFVDLLEQMGCRVTERTEAPEASITVTGGRLKGIKADLNAISDTAQTLAVVALFAEGPTSIRNVAHIRHKETDRIGALATELRKLGAEVDEHSDGLTIYPRPFHGAPIATYDDHRMAMSFALAGLRVPGVFLENPGCTAKTYPNFFDDLAKLRAQ